jgi:hypothetical protein
MGNYKPMLMLIGLLTKKSISKAEIRKPEALVKFQVGRCRRRRFVNWSECFKLGNYHPILMKFDTETKKSMLRSKVTKGGMIDRLQNCCRRRVGNSSACYKMGNYHPISMEIGTQTQENMLIECKSHKSGSLRQKTSKN